MQFKFNLIQYLKFLILSLLIVYIYSVLSYFVTQMPIVAGKRVLFIEFPIYLAFVSIFYFQNAHSTIYKYFLPHIPGLFLYISLDAVYYFLSRSARFSDFANVMTIYVFYPLAMVGIALLLLLLLFIIYKIFAHAKHSYSRASFQKSLAIRVVLFFLLLLFLQSNLFKTLQEHTFEYMAWSDASTIKKNGRFNSFLYYTQMEQKNRVKLLRQSNNTINIANTLYKNKPIQKPNIYFVVLESFINPNYIQNTEYSKNPLSPTLLPFLNKGNFSHIISPVYGGNTAQAEFEILTGIHAFAKVNTIEFNVLKGGRINSFLAALKKNDYETKAVIASDSSFFNSKAAYKSIGFDSTTFLKETKEFRRNPNDKKIFDGDLFDFNIRQIKKEITGSKKPLFSYILGMYGHVPYERNPQDRPNLIKIKGQEKSSIERIANQFYYRTEALAKYINNILRLDPNAIIAISSDHIPAIISRNTKYRYEKHINIALLLNRGKFINISTLHQYQLPQKIWTLLTGEKKLPQLDNNTMEKLYFKALYEGIINP